MDENALVDIPATEAMMDKLPTPPPGYKIARVDIVVRLKRKDEPDRGG